MFIFVLAHTHPRTGSSDSNKLSIVYLLEPAEKVTIVFLLSF